MAKGKTEVVQTRVSAEVEARFREAAALSGMTFSEWVRNTLELEADSVLPPCGQVTTDSTDLPATEDDVDAGRVVDHEDVVAAVEKKLGDLPNHPGGSMWSCPTCAKNGRPRRNYAKDAECNCGTKRPKGA